MVTNLSKKVAVLKLKRIVFTDLSTIGTLELNNNFICNTLEDKDRDLFSSTPLEKIKNIKVYKHTAIPYGTYNVELLYSPRFKKILPRLLNVPGFEGILIHSGNTNKDTEGCILVGEYNNLADTIGLSKVNFDKLMKELKKYETIFIEITK